MKYEIFYDYCSEDGYEERNISETFEGTWSELQDCIKQMKKQGCYNIEANAIGE
jgi:predicted enzyme involved in methoxymalonyl-ACP biosynthesis